MYVDSKRLWLFGVGFEELISKVSHGSSNLSPSDWGAYVVSELHNDTLSNLIRGNW